jgi:hypothetical protein
LSEVDVVSGTVTVSSSKVYFHAYVIGRMTWWGFIPNVNKNVVYASYFFNDIDSHFESKHRPRARSELFEGLVILKEIAVALKSCFQSEISRLQAFLQMDVTDGKERGLLDIIKT